MMLLLWHFGMKALPECHFSHLTDKREKFYNRDMSEYAPKLAMTVWVQMLLETIAKGNVAEVERLLETWKNE